MKKLKDKLIHLFGGYTESDMLLRARPVKVRTFDSDIRTIRVRSVLRNDMIEAFPDCAENAKKDMAYRIGDNMLNEGLITIESSQSTTVADSTEITETAKVLVPFIN